MRYLGGKSRIAGWLAEQFKRCYKGQPYFEPFVGAAWVMSRFTTPDHRHGNDICKPLICLFEALGQGWRPPERVSEDEYRALQEAPLSPLKAFAGFGCSWGGKWFGGYARSGERNYASNARNSLLKQAPHLHNVHWTCRDYREAQPDGFFIYADPPYRNTTCYDYSTNFDSDTFWDTMRYWSRRNTVLVSEYWAPRDFKAIAELPRLQDIRFADGNRHTVTERLFAHESLRLE